MKPFSTSHLITNGRPSKCTPKVIELICTLIRQGKPITQAAPLVGLAPTTVYRWLAVGQQHAELEHDDFICCFSNCGNEAALMKLFLSANEADTQYKQELEDLITGAAKESAKNWFAAAWLLERKFPHEYSLMKTRELQPQAAKLEIIIRDERKDVMQKALADQAKMEGYEVIETEPDADGVMIPVKSPPDKESS